MRARSELRHIQRDAGSGTRIGTVRAEKPRAVLDLVSGGLHADVRHASLLLLPSLIFVCRTAFRLRLAPSAHRSDRVGGDRPAPSPDAVAHRNRTADYCCSAAVARTV